MPSSLLAIIISIITNLYMYIDATDSSSVLENTFYGDSFRFGNYSFLTTTNSNFLNAQGIFGYRFVCSCKCFCTFSFHFHGKKLNSPNGDRFLVLDPNDQMNICNYLLLILYHLHLQIPLMT